MGIRISDYNGALELLQTRCGGLPYKELVEFLHRIVLIRYAGKSKKTKGLEFLQTCMNHTLDHVLKFHYGWHTQVYIPGSTDDNLDFYKKWEEDFRVWMECELSNTARADADIRKLRTVFQHGLSDVAILIVPMSALAHRIDRNVASFERVRKILKKDKSITFPLLLVGLELDEEKVVDVTNWGYELGQLKGKTEGDPVAKTHLATRIWQDHMLPALPSNSMHQRHLDTVARLGFNPGLRQPAFPEFKPLVEVIPEILTLNEDGTTALFVDVPRAESRLTEAPNASSKLSHDAKPRTSPPSAKPAPARQMQLALGLADSPSEKVAATVSTSGPNSIPDAFPVRHSQPSPTDLTTLRHIHLPAGNSESTFAKEKFAPAEIQLSLGINPDGPSPSLRPTGSVVQQYPAPRPATKAVDGPRLGPWLSRGGAAASPFVRSFA